MNTGKFFTKKVTAAVAAVTVLAVMLTGTFAWFSTISAKNIFSNGADSDIPPAVLHDDYKKGGPQKNVYVENTNNPADPDSDIYVRVQLREYMNLLTGNEKIVPKIPEADWHTHTPTNEDPKWTDGLYHHEDCLGFTKPGELFHKYFDWTWGSDSKYPNQGKIWYLPAKDQPATSWKDGYVQDILTDPTASGTNLRETHPANIISIDTYLLWDLDVQEAWFGWIYDVNDGWAYWSQPLKAETATGPLLREVTGTSLLDGKDYVYVIDVIMDAVNADDLDAMWLNDLPSADGSTVTLEVPTSADAKKALEIIQGFTA